MANPKRNIKHVGNLNTEPERGIRSKPKSSKPIVIQTNSTPIRITDVRKRLRHTETHASISAHPNENAATPVVRKRILKNAVPSGSFNETAEHLTSNRQKPGRKMTNCKLMRPERRCHGQSRYKDHVDQKASPKAPEKAAKVSRLLKKTVNRDEHQDASNKHVDNKSIQHNLLDTEVEIEYDISLGEEQSEPASKDNTNLGTSASPPLFLELKSSSNPVVRRAFCDRISTTFDPTCIDTDSLIAKARYLCEVHGEHYTLSPLAKRHEDFYRHGYRLLDMESNPVALIQFDPKRSRMNYARIEFNPAAIGVKGIRQLRRAMKGLFGPDFRNDLANGNFSRLDATTDIKKIRPHDLMFFSDRARISGLWARSFNRNGSETWQTETLTIGSPTSDYFAEVYDKTAQLWKVKGTVIDELITRIEVRFTPRDKNAASMRVKDILHFKNPFSPINIAYYPAPEDGDYRFQFFVCAARWYGTEEALRMIKDRNIRSRYWNLLLDHEPDWWQPEEMWAQFLEDLRNLDFFPDCIFVKKSTQ